MLLSEANILIGDDSILARKQLMNILTELGGVTFTEAADGQEAVDKFRETKPDIVFLDIVMPVKDGIQATKEIIEADESAIIIIVSSIGTKDQLKHAIESGAKDFVQKPFAFDQIKQIIDARFDK